MKRAIHFFPDLPLEVSELRKARDPLGEKIPPHITVVFPFVDEMAGETLLEHVEKCLEKACPIDFALGSAEIGPGGYIWLPVMKGKDEIVRLHGILHTGPLLRHRSALHEYVPHVTVARTSFELMATAHAEASRLPANLQGTLDKIVVESIAPDDSSEVLWTLALNGKSTN